MLETNEQRALRLGAYSLEYLKLKAISEMPLFPEKGETWSFRGGLGNKVLRQMKNEEGVIYERVDPTEDWNVMDTSKVLERMLKSMGDLCKK